MSTSREAAAAWALRASVNTSWTVMHVNHFFGTMSSPTPSQRLKKMPVGVHQPGITIPLCSPQFRLPESAAASLDGVPLHNPVFLHAYAASSTLTPPRSFVIRRQQKNELMRISPSRFGQTLLPRPQSGARQDCFSMPNLRVGRFRANLDTAERSLPGNAEPDRSSCQPLYFAPRSDFSLALNHMPSREMEPSSESCECERTHP